MKIVFIAGPFRGDGSIEAKEANVEVAKQYIEKFIEHEIPYYSPHLNINQEALKCDGDKGVYAITTNHAFLERSDAMAVLPGWETSSGTLEEVNIAKKCGMEIFYLEEPDAISRIKSYLEN